MPVWPLLQAHGNTAFSIMHEIAMSASQTEEQSSYTSMVQTFAAEMASIDRANTHFVPFYTKSTLAKLLQTYYDDLLVYDSEMKKAEDDQSSDEVFVAAAGECSMLVWPSLGWAVWCHCYNKLIRSYLDARHE